MVSQYPHKLIVQVDTPATRDAKGNWVAGGSTTVEHLCRTEPNGSGRFITLDDGSSYQYESMIYLPLGADLKKGDHIQVKDGEQVIAQGQIKRFHRGQLNMRVWL